MTNFFTVLSPFFCCYDGRLRFNYNQIMQLNCNRVNLEIADITFRIADLSFGLPPFGWVPSFGMKGGNYSAAFVSVWG